MTKKGVYKRKDGRYEARLQLGNKQQGNRVNKSFYGKSADEALHKMYEYKMFNNAGDYTDMTVKELCYEWLIVEKNKIKPSTAANYQMKLEKHIVPFFSDVICYKLTRRDIYAFISEKLQSGLSPRYVADLIVVLKSVYKYARREYDIACSFRHAKSQQCYPVF